MNKFSGGTIFNVVCLVTILFLMSPGVSLATTDFGQIIGAGADSERWSRAFAYVNGEPTVTVSNGNQPFDYVFTVPAGADRDVDGTEMNGAGDLIWEALGECIDMITNQIIAARPTRQEQLLWKGSRWRLDFSLRFVIKGVDEQGKLIANAETFQTSAFRALRSSGHESWSVVLPALARTTSSSFGYGPINTNTNPLIRTSNDAAGVRFVIGSDTLILGSGSCRRISPVKVVCLHE